MDRRRPPVELGEFVVGVGEADVQPFDFADPVFALGFDDAGTQVVSDLLEAGSLP